MFFQVLKTNCYIKEKEPQVFCMTIHTKKIKKQLINLQQLPSAENEVGDILPYNEELG